MQLILTKKRNKIHEEERTLYSEHTQKKKLILGENEVIFYLRLSK